MEMRKEQVRAAWVKPALVRKPVQETLSGLGKDDDTIGGKDPLQS
jgi:hypothetical protein